VTGSSATTLVVLRGNSGSGKTTVAEALRRARPEGEVAVLSQDVVRRAVLGVHDTPANPSIGLMDVMVRHLLDRGTSVVLEGILHAPTYGGLVLRLVADHAGTSRAYRWDLTFEETLRRHGTRPWVDFGEPELRRWWQPDPALPGLAECPIGPGESVTDVVWRIVADCGW
jgi:energy-coupling factor transporter ATP-binding protein EcfA2